MHRAMFLAAGLVAAFTIPARSEVIGLNCVDRDGASVASFTIDTDSQRIEQKIAGAQPVQMTASQIMATSIRFYDASGDARIFRKWDRTNGEFFSEFMEGPKKGLSTYWKCTKSN